MKEAYPSGGGRERADLLDDLGVREGRDVAELVTTRDVAQQSAHDLFRNASPAGRR
jgi:hypothetical protein